MKDSNLPIRSLAHPDDAKSIDPRREAHKHSELSRRGLLGGLGAASLGAIAGRLPAAAAPRSTAPAPPHGANLQDRKLEAHAIRVAAADAELALPEPLHATNGDEELYSNRIGNFSKTLPHDDLGQVDPAAYDALLAAVTAGTFEAFETVPAGGGSRLANPVGGLAYSIDGPDSPAIGVANPPPAFASAELAAEMAELYWMAILRDINFQDFEAHPDAVKAREQLATFSGYRGPRDPVTGEIRANDLFRVEYPGVQDGYLVSQFLLQGFSYDGAPVGQRVTVGKREFDFLTTFDEWLESQRGFPGGTPAPPPGRAKSRYVTDPRALGFVAGRDMVFSAYFKAFLILNQLVGASGYDQANPYQNSGRQLGFGTFGAAHLAELLGKAHKAERSCWYEKWFVHRFLRPEEYAARVHATLAGMVSHPIHSDLLNATITLGSIFDRNLLINNARLSINNGSWMLPQLFPVGCPTHPSFPAGHAVTAGACVTVLKAWFDESLPFPSPKKPTPDGSALVDYITGVDGPELTLGGELNKLAYNLTWGRDMSGIHWRSDDREGNLLGEAIALRLLREERAIYQESFAGFSLTTFSGETITV